MEMITNNLANSQEQKRKYSLPFRDPSSKPGITPLQYSLRDHMICHLGFCLEVYTFPQGTHCSCLSTIHSLSFLTKGTSI